jgi:uracil-DNA glycosylase
VTDSSWHSLLESAYLQLSEEYRGFLESNSGYFPSKTSYLNAFKTLPKDKVRYILFGQDPYPREESATGYAFIDGKVGELFSEKGLSKAVNRATSLRNFIKMTLVAEGVLDSEDLSQQKIASVDKSSFISSIDELRHNFEKNGVLLLNTALIFTDKKSSTKHIKAWQPFIRALLEGLREDAPTLILFGTHAKALKDAFDLEMFETIEMEHPYNTSFISNPKAEKLFGPMKLLAK